MSLLSIIVLNINLSQVVTKLLINKLALAAEF